MTTPLLTTKLYIRPVQRRERVVPRPHLIEQLNEGLRLGRKLTLISAPAGFGKTTLVSEWLAQVSDIGDWGLDVAATDPSPIPNPQYPKLAWLSLDEGDNDPTRFLAYFIAALQSIEDPREQGGNIGTGALSALRASQSQAPPFEAVLTSLINEIAAFPDRIVLVLDDYHLIEAQPVHEALTFLLEHLPPPERGLHLVIATREDPHLPLARLRARGDLTELRATDLRFTLSEAAQFLNQVMGLKLSAEDIAALETRTEGWIAGLQLAAISMQGRKDVTSRIKSFTGSHRFVLDYLVEEVLGQQPESVQTFLLRTSILDRLCGPLCDAVRFGYAESPSTPEGDAVRFVTAESPSTSEGSAAGSEGTAVRHRGDGLHPTPSASGQEILEYLEQANLFIVTLDDERRWYRYHHLFADLLRQRLQQSLPPSFPPMGGDEGGGELAELHRRASQWYENNGLEIQAFHHAAAANDVERAARLIEGEGMPLTFRGALTPVLNWLESLPSTVLDAKPLLWVTYASAILAAGQRTGVEQRLQAAEAALRGVEPDDVTRDVVGRIAATRATLAWGQNQAETIIAQSRRALAYLHPDNLPFRTSTIWKLGSAYELQGDRAAASRAYSEAIAICQASGNVFIDILASTGLGGLQEAENQLYLADQTYRRILRLVGDPPLLAACGAYLGLARVCYEWNELVAAQQHGQQSVQLARQVDSNDAFASCGVFLARLKLTQGDVTGAAAILAEADQFVRQHNFLDRLPEVAAEQVRQLLHQGDLAAAADLAAQHELPLSQARVHLAQADPSAALAALDPWRRQVEAKGWQDERLKFMVLQAVALHEAALQADGDPGPALRLLGDALALAEPGGFIRLFVDEGMPMARLLHQAAVCGMMPDYTAKLLAAFEDVTKDRSGGQMAETAPPSSVVRRPSSALVEPLSPRELKVLQLIAEGLTNPEIAARLYLSLNTVKAHTRNIYGKLDVHSRTQAVARSQELGLLASSRG